MIQRASRTIRYLLLAVTLFLPAILVYSSIRTFRALEEQKYVYLRSCATSLAALLETLPADQDMSTTLRVLAEQEPGFVNLKLFDRPADPDSDSLGQIWRGRELFRTEPVRVEGEALFRAYIPYHSPLGLRIARIDMATRAADFLIVHARRNILIAAVAGVVLAGLSLATAWSVKRAAVAEQRQMELEHLAHIGTLSAVLAHEIRNPLGTIKGFAQLLEERAGRANHELVEPILAETSRLETLVKDLLLYGRPPRAVPSNVDAQALAESLRPHARAAIGPRPVRFKIQAEPLVFACDANLLAEALLNLIRNAVESVGSLPSGGEVCLASEVDKEQMVFRVTDNGPGLCHDVLDHLFEPFYTTKASGTGLGLPITRKLARILGGDFSLGNRPEGGAWAEIRLPRRARMRSTREG